MARKILVVDDNIINRQLLRKTLSDEYDIIEASDGYQALLMMSKNYKMLSAVLLDIMMPVMNGYEVLQHVRANTLLSQLPIIIITGAEDEDSRVKALSYGANDFILKPINPEIVRHCLKNNIALRETASILNAIQRDKLTGLYNREVFFDKVSMMLKEKEPGYYVLSCFDIDNFKLINDQFGAEEGDRLLREIGASVSTNMSEIGGVAGRISGDNFAAIFPVSKKDTDVLQKIQEKNLVTLEKQTVVFSVGRYVVVDTTLSPSSIYDRAYIAKQSIKGRYDEHVAYFDEAMLDKLVRDQQIIAEMETALNEKQFEVWFQPQYNHVTGALIGSEALVRWRHPQKGLVSPGDFIPLFEQNGFIYELDKYVWREVCRYQRHWIDTGLMPLPVSVNISRYDIFRADLFDFIVSLVDEFHLPVDLLRLEVTESAFTQSTERIVKIVKKLIDYGFTVEIDDFGSGYSSLNTLKSVPAQVVKLDMRFLEESEDDEVHRGGNILESVVRMTKWLGMSVIAEGVETQVQGDFLKSIGCSNVQGYLYARPMPAADYEILFSGADREDRVAELETVDGLDNNSFWNPSSIDTLIFNSYVGAACIYEYNDGKIELLRATDKYAKMLGGDMTVEDVLKLDLSQHLDEKSGKLALHAMNESARTKGEASGEFLFLDLPGCPHKTYIRSTMRVIASTESRYLVYCISDNITAQREAEIKERKLAKQLSALLDNINCGVTAVTIAGDDVEFLLANDQYFEILGYTREQYDSEVGKDVFTLIHPDDRERTKNTSMQLHNDSIPVSLEYRVIRRDKKVLWIRSFMSTTHFEDIDETVQLCTYVDISSEKQATQDLLDNMPGGAAMYEFDGETIRIIHINKSFWELMGQSRTGKMDKNSGLSSLHPDDRAPAVAELNAAICEHRDAVCDVRIQYGDPNLHQYAPFRINAKVVDNGNGHYLLYATYHAISDEAMSIQNMLPIALRAVMESSTTLSFVKDSKMRYICCSKSFADFAGIKDPSDVVGKTDFDLFDTAVAQQFRNEDETLFKTKESLIDSSLTILAADNSEHIMSVSKYPLLDQSGECTGLYGTAIDTTQAAETETQQKFLIDSIPGGVAIYDGDGRNLDSITLKYFSDGFCHMLGYTREEYNRIENKKRFELIAEEDLPEYRAQIARLIKTGTPIDYVYRSRTKTGEYISLMTKATIAEQKSGRVTVYSVFFDVSDRQLALEQLRISEEENRLAIQHSNTAVCRYDVATKTLRLPSRISPMYDTHTEAVNTPDSQISNGRISPETSDTYRRFFDDIIAGVPTGEMVFKLKTTVGFRWVKAKYSSIFSRDHQPVSAVISFVDTTEDYEKESAYAKWLLSFHSKDPDSYSLLRCNVNKRTVINTPEGSLLALSFDPNTMSLDEYTAQYLAQCIFEEDKNTFFTFLGPDALLEKYYRGERTFALEYKEKQLDGSYRWLKLTVDLIEYPHSADIEAYLLFENIDEAKRLELLTIERAETDPLTGVLNRVTFAEKANELIKKAPQGAMHALLMLDIDGFKLVNDAFGHAAGDQALIEIAKTLSSILRRDDLVGRLGGDEFVVFLNDIPDKTIAANKAKQICELVRKSFSLEVQISGSIGIAMVPQDGTCFEALYKKSDETLYYVKGSGRNNYAFYRDAMSEGDTEIDTYTDGHSSGYSERRRRMLIVDDNDTDFELLANMFKRDFIIDKAKDGNSALVRLRHYGSAVSVVLLDLMMPGMDGFTVLEKMRLSAEMATIPVIVVSGDEDRETSLKAIRLGASDYVTKPVDAEILRIRVNSAVSKAENERLRAKNSFLEYQNSETARYKTVLDRIGLAVIEMDWGKGSFLYSDAISEHIAGIYDDRTLWHILLSDMVTDSLTVRRLQQLVHDIADDREHTEGETSVVLKTPSGKKHNFSLKVYKITNEYGLADKIILTFRDIEDA